MKCSTIHNKLIFFLDNDLPENENMLIRNHLAECPECASFAADMKKTLDILDDEKSPEVNLFFYTRLKARMENQSVIPEKAASRKIWAKILQPAFFTLLLLAGIYSGYKIGEPKNMKNEYSLYSKEELFPYINEMQTEPIENFLME